MHKSVLIFFLNALGYVGRALHERSEHLTHEHDTV